MTIAVIDTRKKAASPPNKIVTSSLPTASAPTSLGEAKSPKSGVKPPPPEPKVTPPKSTPIPLLLAAMLEEGVEFPTVEEFNDEAFEAQCYWVIARHDLSEARNWAGGEKSFETHLATYRKAGKPVGFLSVASTDPGEEDPDGGDADAVGAHAGADDGDAAKYLVAAVEAWFAGDLADPSAEVLAKAKAMNPGLYMKCVLRDQDKKKAVEKANDEAQAQMDAEAAAVNPPVEKTGKNKPRWSLQRRELAAKMMKEGSPLDAVVAAVNLPVEMVQAYMEELGAVVVPQSSDSAVVDEKKPEKKPDEKKPEVFQAKVSVTVNPLDPPDAVTLECVLAEKRHGDYDEGRNMQPKSADQLIEHYERLLHAARWLKQSGVI